MNKYKSSRNKSCRENSAFNSENRRWGRKDTSIVNTEGLSRGWGLQREACGFGVRNPSNSVSPSKGL